MKKLIFATHNVDKVKEVRNQLMGTYEILGLNDIGFHEEIIEDWQLGIRFTAGVAIGAYLLGYIAGLVVNFTLLLFHKDDK